MSEIPELTELSEALERISEPNETGGLWVPAAPDTIHLATTSIECAIATRLGCDFDTDGLPRTRKINDNFGIVAMNAYFRKYSTIPKNVFANILLDDAEVQGSVWVPVAAAGHTSEAVVTRTVYAASGNNPVHLCRPIRKEQTGRIAPNPFHNPKNTQSSGVRAYGDPSFERGIGNGAFTNTL